MWIHMAMDGPKIDNSVVLECVMASHYPKSHAPAHVIAASVAFLAGAAVEMSWLRSGWQPGIFISTMFLLAVGMWLFFMSSDWIFPEPLAYFV